MQIVETLEDFIQYFIHTYIAKREGDQRVPFLVEKSTRTGIVLQPTSKEFREAGVGKISVPFNEIIETYELTHPSTGAISTDNTVIYITLSPRRQYKKGVCENRLNIHKFHGTKLAPELVHISYWVHSLYNNKYFKFNELLKLMQKGERIGGAISPKIGVIVRKGIALPLITYKDKIIGVVEKNYIKILPQYLIYKDPIYRATNTNIIVWD